MVEFLRTSRRTQASQPGLNGFAAAAACFVRDDNTGRACTDSAAPKRHRRPKREALDVVQLASAAPKVAGPNSFEAVVVRTPDGRGQRGAIGQADLNGALDVSRHRCLKGAAGVAGWPSDGVSQLVLASGMGRGRATTRWENAHQEPK